jgi:hypothetical protein
VSCAVRKLSTGFIRATITLKNTTSATRSAYLFGPPLIHIRHIYPLLAPAPVMVTVSGVSRSYVGFLVPHVLSDKTVYILLRLAPPLRGQSILASSHHAIKASSWSVLNNNDCVL